MKVGEVAKLLEGMALGLADLSRPTSKGLDILRAGLEPFAEQTVEQHVEFLRQCEEYAKTGTVVTGRKRMAAKPQTPTLTVADAATQVRSLLGEINQGSVSTPRIDSLITALEKLKKPELDQLLVALEISGRPKSKKEAIERIRSVLNSQLEMHVKAQALDSDRGGSFFSFNRT